MATSRGACNRGHCEYIVFSFDRNCGWLCCCSALEDVHVAHDRLIGPRQRRKERPERDCRQLRSVERPLCAVVDKHLDDRGEEERKDDP